MSIKSRTRTCLCASIVILSSAGSVTAQNDDCVDRIAIFDGATPFTTIGAATDGLPHASCMGDGQTYEDVWFNYNATCTGNLTVSTCGTVDYDSDLVAYDGCNCPPASFLGCNDDGAGCIFSSLLTVPVTQGNCYKLRVGGWGAGDEGSGTVTLTCEAAAVCGNGIVEPGEDCDGGACCQLDCTYSVAECRPSAGVCDPAESCTGNSADCPPDIHSTSVCRPDAGACDVPESCDGVNNACPPDFKEPAGTVCGPSTGPCDPAEVCDGSSNGCPPNVIITDCINGDGCCPAGCNSLDDSDCPGECLVDADCADGLFCNGAETCVAGSCQAGPIPCPGEACDEASDTCTDCTVLPPGTACDDNDACTVFDACDEAGCLGEEVDTIPCVTAQDCLDLTGLPGVECPNGFCSIDAGAGCPCTCVNPPQDMVAWWPLDETTLFGSANDHAGSIIDFGTYLGALTPVQAVVDGGLSFSGSGDFVEVLDSPEIDLGTSDLTIDAWIQTSASTGVVPIVDKRANPGPFGYMLFLSSGNPALQLADGSSRDYISTGGFVADNNPHHVAVTVARNPPTATGIRFYVDGKLLLPAFNPSNSTGSLDNTADLRIGADSLSGLYFTGVIDEVEIFKRKLSGKEVRAIRAARQCGKCKCSLSVPKRVYTLNADFDDLSSTPQGILQDVNYNTPHQLQLDSLPVVGTAYPFVWVANSGAGTVSKIDTKTGNEVGRYYTGPPDGAGQYTYLSPSRTTVDLNGNCWVGNRAGVWASVTQILVTGGGVNTSADCCPTPDGKIDPANPLELRPWGTDDRVVRHYRVDPLLSSIPITDWKGVRALAIDRDGYLWVGHWGEGKCLKLKPDLSGYAPASYTSSLLGPAPITTLPGLLCSVDTLSYNGWNTRPYGLALSPNGNLYVSGRVVRTVLEIDPLGCVICQGHQGFGGNPYGIAVDADCIVWMGNTDGLGGRCIRWDPGPPSLFTLPIAGPGSGCAYSFGKGITVHPYDGTIWMACDADSAVAHFDHNGTPLGIHTTRLAGGTCSAPAHGEACIPVGIGVDIKGGVIAVGQNSDSWAKLHGTGLTGTVGGIITTLTGPQRTGRLPYSYSDITGNLSTLTTQQGSWTVVYDSQVNNALWGKVSWHSLEPQNTSIEVYVRADNNIGSSSASTGLYSHTPTQVYNDIPFGTCCVHPIIGQYIEVRTVLLRTRPAPGGTCPTACADPFPPSPVLYDLTVRGLCCDPDGACAPVCGARVVPCDDPTGATVFYDDVGSVGDCDQQAGVTCAPPSGSHFPIGSSEILCTALDAKGEPVSCTIDLLVYQTPDCLGPSGSCCVGLQDSPAMSCLDQVSAEYCAAQAGIYLGDGTQCRKDTCEPCTPPPPGLVAWWPGDDCQAGDLTGQHHGTFSGTPKCPAEFLVGDGALAFGSGTYITVPHAAALNPGDGDITIDAWIQTTSSGLRPIVEKLGPAGGYALSLDNGLVVATACDVDSCLDDAQTAVLVNDGLWHHVAATLTRTGLTAQLDVYVDGVAMASSSGALGTVASSNALWIGAGPAFPGAFFAGVMDEIEIAGRALDPAEIAAIAAAGGAGKCKESGHLEPHVPCCGTEATDATLTICNHLNAPQSYAWSLPGPPTNEECDIAPAVGPSGAATVAAGTCTAIPVSIHCPSGLPPSGGTSCTGAVVANTSTQTLVGSKGRLIASGAYCFDVASELVEAPIGTVVTVSIEATNLDDASESLDYELAVVPSAGGADPAPVSLNGLPPGTPVTGSISIPLGMTAPIEVDVEFLAFDALTVYDLVVSYDVDGGGSNEAVSSVGLRSVLPCTNAGDCGDANDDGLRDDACAWYECAGGNCVTVMKTTQADIGDLSGACPPDTSCDGGDRFHALNCFSNKDTTGLPPYPCESSPPDALNADAGSPSSCTLDAVCDANDAFHALNCFADKWFDGSTGYQCNCPPPGPEPAEGQPSLPAGPLPRLQKAGLTLRAPSMARPGDLIPVHVHLDTDLEALRGYQLHLSATGGGMVNLELVDITVDTRRRDYAFAGVPGVWSAFNRETAQMVAGLDDPDGVPAQAGSYLATFTYRVPKDASGTFVIELRYDGSSAAPQDRTFLFGRHAGLIDVTSITPLRITVVANRRH